MSLKSDTYQALKAAGVAFERPYAQWTTEQLVALAEQNGVELPAPKPKGPALPPRKEARIPTPKDDMAGLQLNRKAWDEPIRTDPDGVVWFQDEVRKPAYPKPRGRRVLKYNDPGVQTKTIKAGEYVETIEVAGDRNRASEIKITLPSYQVGLYLDPRFPFRIHVYNDVRGFNIFDVQDFYGGAELVPPSCKRVYVENVLCYDIRSVVQAITNEYRQRELDKLRG